MSGQAERLHDHDDVRGGETAESPEPPIQAHLIVGLRQGGSIGILRC